MPSVARAAGGLCASAIVETPSPYTEYGIKGGGEGGRMGAPPAIVAAIEDALRPLGVRIDTAADHAARLRTLIREAEARKGGGR